MKIRPVREQNFHLINLLITVALVLGHISQRAAVIPSVATDFWGKSRKRGSWKRKLLSSEINQEFPRGVRVLPPQELICGQLMEEFLPTRYPHRATPVNDEAFRQQKRPLLTTGRDTRNVFQPGANATHNSLAQVLIQEQVQAMGLMGGNIMSEEAKLLQHKRDWGANMTARRWKHRLFVGPWIHTMDILSQLKTFRNGKVKPHDTQLAQFPETISRSPTEDHDEVRFIVSLIMMTTIRRLDQKPEKIPEINTKSICPLPHHDEIRYKIVINIKMMTLKRPLEQASGHALDHIAINI